MPRAYTSVWPSSTQRRRLHSSTRGASCGRAARRLRCAKLAEALAAPDRGRGRYGAGMGLLGFGRRLTLAMRASIWKALPIRAHQLDEGPAVNAMSPGPVTLQDVANEAGVSLATASRAINGSTRKVRQDLHERVLIAAAKLNYAAN